MKMASIWKTDKSDDPTALNTWLGTLVTTIEVNFPLSAVFVTTGVPPQRILDWLAINTTDRVSVQHLDDGRGVIVVGNKHDASRLKTEFADHLDFGVISTSSPPERIRDFIKNAGKKPL